jgi:hypothetical protein
MIAFRSMDQVAQAPNNLLGIFRFTVLPVLDTSVSSQGTRSNGNLPHEQKGDRLLSLFRIYVIDPISPPSAGSPPSFPPFSSDVRFALCPSESGDLWI